MDFAAITLFLMLYYIRPHEWIHFVSTMRLAAFSLVFAIFATLMRERGFSPKDLFRTPLDWIVTVYIGWIIVSGESMIDTWQHVYAYLLYYLVTAQALSGVQRIQRFLNWWTLMILAVAVL